jgi:ABC-type Zn uptake system ZnuABC Zn-binding protein ZnuA
MRRSAGVRILATVLALALAGVVAACAGSQAQSGTAGPGAAGLRVVATTSVLADLVRSVAGPDAVVDSLVPRGGDVHTFDPAPSDLGRVAAADLIVGNGLGLDDWVIELAKDSGATAPLVALGEDLPGVTYLDEQNPAEHNVNPHLWLDVSVAGAYVDRIAQALETARPGDAPQIRARAADYAARLAALDAELRGRFGALPADQRRIVSFHDAFPYFARAYGLEIVGVVVDAPGQDPSAGEVAALIDAIRASGARAILAEVQFNDRLARQIASESGASVISGLYTDSVGDPPLDTYEAIIRQDADLILAALE